MRRTLVLTNEAARHRFRQSMPRPVIEREFGREPLSDRALFVLTFFAAFLAFSTYLA